MSFDEILREQSEQVERTNRMLAAAEERAYQRSLQGVIDEAMQKIGPLLREPKPKPDHAFQPYSNPKTYPGCVRCGYPRDAHPDQ